MQLVSCDIEIRKKGKRKRVFPLDSGVTTRKKGKKRGKKEG